MKISVIGAGNVGATAAHYLLEDRLADELVVVDVVPGLAKGKCLDFLEASPLRQYPIKVTGTEDFSEIRNSNIVVVTAGIARKPGMSRLDLLKTNEKIMKDVAMHIKTHASGAFVLVVSNPLDVMCYVALKTTGFPKNRVFGMAGVLDTSRFRYFVAEKLQLNPTDIQAMVLGGHGDEMVPIISTATVSGIPLTHFLNKTQIQEIVERTQKAGAEIVSYLKTGSAFYSPAASVVEMVRCLVTDVQKILPLACYLEGEYDAHDLYCGVPARLGREGVLEIIEIHLNPEEKEAMGKSLAAVKASLEELK